MHTQHPDFLIIGGGIFGLSTAITLAKRKHTVHLINPDSIPHHLAASTDVSKIVRMEYGSDTEYFEMAEQSIAGWHDWNDLFGETLYHEVGFLMLCTDRMESKRHQYELASCAQLQEHGYALDRLNPTTIRKRFPSINADVYTDGNYNPHAGFVESGRVISKLAAYARSLGVEIKEGQTAGEFVVEKGQLQAVKTKEGRQFHCGHAIVAAGAHTPYLLPELQPFMRSTGHPVFWLKPMDSSLFSPSQLPVFTADISNSGWYGFPVHPKEGIVKISRHGEGLPIHPDLDDRRVRDDEVQTLRTFLQRCLPALADAPLVYTRRCLYTDTLDGHFWIDQHPEIKGLSVSTGGSGHAMKMGPVLGEMVADMAEDGAHRFSSRYRWRNLNLDTQQVEEARYKE